jgi:prepilin-type processing-associated H-X9-DG protein
MPQMQMPFFPQGVTHINNMLAFSKDQGRISYFTGNLQLYVHEEKDTHSFRMITAQFCVNAIAKQAEIVRAFGVPGLAVKRAVKLLRQEGTRGFYKPRHGRSAAVLVPQVCVEVQTLLDSGMAIAEVAKQKNIKADTLCKAVRAGRFRLPVRTPEAEVARCKSERSEQDGVAPMGMGASNVEARVAASLGSLVAVAPLFQAELDVPCAGVLFALPALLAMGLLDGAEKYLKLPDGYYGLDSLLLLCAFMGLARLDSMEELRYRAPGEWGKLLGLDRIPEVRTMRHKLRLLSANEQPEKWSEALSERWMQQDPAQANVLYVDGHVRVYHGQQTKLPLHHVARQKLCLRATTDYWVNAMDGQPFFMVNQAVDPGLIEVIERDILPRLGQGVPRVPGQSLEATARQHRFTLVFDREGYSPDFLQRMRKQRVACLTYHKFPGDDWADDEFHAYPVRQQTGDVAVMDLAERGTCLSNKLWVREIRKRTAKGHQVAILTTDYRSQATQLAGAMFSRWSQENYFRYAREHFGLDRLAEYCTDLIPDTVKLVNPVWRELDGELRKANATLSRVMAQFGAINMPEKIEVEKMELWIEQKAQLKEEIEHSQAAVEALKANRKATPHHVSFAQLSEDQKFHKLRTHSKHLVDTIMMIDYRAETAMANILRSVIKRPDEARTLLRALYTTEADLIPDLNAQTLTVRLHHMAQNNSDVAIRKLCDELNATETVFPRTSLRLVLKLGSN